MICDTSALIAFFNGADPDHARVVTVMESARPPMVVSPLMLAELDYLILDRIGDDTARRAVGSLIGGRFEVASCTPADITAALDGDSRYEALGIGLTDASLVVLAHRYRTVNLATLDERPFRAVRPLDGSPAFHILPADA